MNEKDNLLRHIKNLLEMVADDSATIELQAAQLEQYAKMHDDERATVLVLRDNIVELRAALDAVPVYEIMQFVHGAQYYPPSGVRDDYMPDDYDADRAVIDAWLRKELSAE